MSNIALFKQATSPIDPVVTIWKNMEAKERASEKALQLADELLESYSGCGNTESVVCPRIKCVFPAYESPRGASPDRLELIAKLNQKKFHIVDDEESLKKAVSLVQGIALLHSKKKFNEAQKIARKWEDDFKNVLALAAIAKDKSGYTKAEKKADDLYEEVRMLRQQLFEAKAESLQGILIQVKEMQQYIHCNGWEYSLKQLKTIEEGLTHLQ